MNGSDCNAHICDETATSTSTKHPTHNNGMVKYMFSMSRLVDQRASKRDVCVYVPYATMQCTQVERNLRKKTNTMLTMAKTKTERNHQLLNTVFLESIDSSFILFLLFLCSFLHAVWRVLSHYVLKEKTTTTMKMIMIAAAAAATDNNHDDDDGKKSNQQKANIT